MRVSILVARLIASALAVSARPGLDTSRSALSLRSVSEFFSKLPRITDSEEPTSDTPLCNLTEATMPLIAKTALPPPSAGLLLKHVAIGRGTQNYTCDTTDSAAVPVSIGAVATLFNASCVAAVDPDHLQMLPKIFLQVSMADSEDTDSVPSGLTMSGRHFFTNITTPFFDLDTSSQILGTAACYKNNSATADSDAPEDRQGELAVPWLKLLARPGATGGLQEIYRVETAGGSAPATCSGMPSSFEVDYAAQYWFWFTPYAGEGYSGTPEER